MENHKTKNIFQFKNELFLKSKYTKNTSYHTNKSLKKDLPKFIIDKKIFRTELNSKDNFYRSKNNHSINIPETKYNYNLKNYYITPRIIEKKKILNEVKDICNELYETKKENNNNNKRNKIKEDIINKVNNYVLTNFKKNIYFPEIKEKRNKSKDFFEKKIKTERKENNMNYNFKTMKDFLEKYYEDPDSNSNSRIMSFENYAKKNNICNHPQIYIINNNLYKEKKLIPIKEKKNMKTFLEFSKLIPERKQDQKEINKQIYTIYKTMKNKNEINFHV